MEGNVALILFQIFSFNIRSADSFPEGVYRLIKQTSVVISLCLGCILVAGRQCVAIVTLVRRPSNRKLENTMFAWVTCSPLQNAILRSKSILKGRTILSLVSNWDCLILFSVIGDLFQYTET